MDPKDLNHLKPSDLPPETTSQARLLTVLGFVLFTAILYFGKVVLIPLALSVLIGFLLSPVVLWLERRGLKRSIAVVTVVAILMCLVSGLGYILAGQFVEFVDNLPKYRSNIVSKVQEVKPGRTGFFKRAKDAITDISNEVQSDIEHTTGSAGKTTPTESRKSDPLENTLTGSTHSEQNGMKVLASIQRGETPGNENAVPVRVVEIPTNSLQSFQEIVGPVFSILGNAGLVILFVIFMLIQREDLRDRVIRLAGYNSVRVTTEALEEAASRVGRYLMMQLIVNVSYGIPIAIGLYFIGVPNAMLWGAMATILRFIPYIGPWIAALMPISLSLAVFDSWTPPLLTIGLFVIVELISNNFLEPILYGHSTGLSPVAIIVSAVFWTWLWGPVGLVLSTPITVCLVVLGRHIPNLAFLHVLLGDEPVLTDHARIYNRLLSGAVDDAVDIAEKYAENNGVGKLFDNVLVPALESAESDRMDEMLSSRRYQKFMAGMYELLDEITDAVKEDDDDKDSEENSAPMVRLVLESHEPAIAKRNIVCIPASDVADECASVMLEHLLSSRNAVVTTVKTGALASEIVNRIREADAKVVLLSSVPPFAVSHLRYLAKRITTELPEVRICVGLWGNAETEERTDERLKLAGVDQVFTTIEEAGIRL